MSEVKKWVCEYCTYENWPSAIKCTLCRGMKPPQLIADQIGQQGRNTYQVSELIQPEEVRGSGELNLINCDATQAGGGGGGGVINAFSKWSCPRCTYLNWPNTSKCSQCFAPRRRTSPTGSVEPSGGNWASVDRRGSPTSPEPPNDVQNDRNRPVSGSIVSKWVCSACTYENWPKSLKCVLCNTARVRPASPEGEENRRNGSLRSSPCIEYQDPPSTSCAGPSASASNNYEHEMRLKQLRKCMREADWPWLNACMGVVNGDPNPVETYLSAGGDPSRQLNQSEVNLLNRSSAFDVGHTLVHLAIRFHREELLALLLAAADASRGAHKRMPCHVSPDLAADILRHLAASIRQRKGDFQCHFVTELATFTLPAEIEELSPDVQEHLFDELLDRDVQKELEEESPIINWSLGLTERLGCRLYALWNRTAGDCLLDSVLQATWGIFDRDNTLRRALSDSLHNAASIFYPRWKEYETMQARMMHFSLDEAQCQHDWALLLSLASQPGASLEQMHIFALAHILRRPVIVYGVKYVKSFRGETIGYARFEGVYLPLLWEQSFCWKSPITLGYTRGHFCSLVTMEPETGDDRGAGANIRSGDDLKVTFLPLNTSDGKLLPVHFLSSAEIGNEERILRQWLDCCVMEGGILVAQQRIQRRPLLVAQMVEEWLNHYRRASLVTPLTRGPVLPRSGPIYASDGDSDDE